MLFQRRVGKGSILPTVLVKPPLSVGNAAAFAHPAHYSQVLEPSLPQVGEREKRQTGAPT